MCDRCEELEEEVRQLKNLLGAHLKGQQLHKVRREFGCKPLEAKVLSALYKARSPVPQERLHSIIYGDREDGGPVLGVLTTVVSQLRNNCGRDVIMTVRVEGWTLSAKSRRRMDKALAT